MIEILFSHFWYRERLYDNTIALGSSIQQVIPFTSCFMTTTGLVLPVDSSQVESRYKMHSAQVASQTGPVKIKFVARMGMA
jgi:hypothetical protein